MDAKTILEGGTGFEKEDFQMDFQTVTRQKSLSEAVVVFISPNTLTVLLKDLKDAMDL